MYFLPSWSQTYRPSFRNEPTLGLGNDDRDGVVVVAAVLFFELDEVLAAEREPELRKYSAHIFEFLFLITYYGQTSCVL